MPKGFQGFQKGNQIAKGKHPVMEFKKGHIVSEEMRKKIGLGNSIALKGKKLSEETKRKISLIAKEKGFGLWMKNKKGAETGNWKGGITLLHNLIRGLPENKNWIKQVFKRDNYACQECFNKEFRLHSHHKNKSFSQLLREFLQKYNQFSPIDDKETLIRLAINYKPFWDISNGQTLCGDCHNETKTKLQTR